MNGTHWRRAMVVAATAMAVPLVSVAGPAFAATSDAIAGTAFYDDNRDGVLDNGEQPIASQVIYLYDGAGQYVTNTSTDSLGRYTFSGLSDGNYQVAVAPSSAQPMQSKYVPTTTGSIYPSVSVSVSGGSATANFGWRLIVWSTTAGSPVSTFVAPSGLRVESYNDAVSASDVYNRLLGGSMLGAEQPDVTVRAFYGNTDVTTTSVTGSNGQYSYYTAISYVTWASWLSNGDAPLFHEYGHSWSLYYAYMVQGDPTLAGYLQARGLADDPRVGSSYAWSPREMIAEDYRQLFGSPAAAAQPQANTDIPPAASVPGLRDYLAGAFQQPPARTTTAPPAVPAPVLSELAVAPAPVRKSGTISFSLNTPATASVTVIDSTGTTVATLLSGASLAAGSNSVTWGRTTSSGARAKSGTYQALVSAANSSGSASATISFTVS